MRPVKQAVLVPSFIMLVLLLFDYFLLQPHSLRAMSDEAVGWEVYSPHPLNLRFPFEAGTEWKVVRGYNQGTHCKTCGGSLSLDPNNGYMRFSLDLVVADEGRYGLTTEKNVVAMADGWYKFWLTSANNSQFIRHPNLYFTMYTHLDQHIDFLPTQLIPQGTIIGETGAVSTIPTIPHIHITLFQDTIDPTSLTKRVPIPLDIIEGSYDFQWDSTDQPQFTGKRGLWSGPEPTLSTAVTPPYYDDIGAVVSRPELGYPWTQIQVTDLANYSLLSQYDVVFINCTNDIQSTPQVASALQQFVQHGGSIYASDFAYAYIRDAFPGRINFPNNPYIGTVQQVTANITDLGLANYINPTTPPSTIGLNFDLPGWVVINSVSANTTVHVQGSFNTYSSLAQANSLDHLRQLATQQELEALGQLTNKPLVVSFQPYGSSGGRVIYTTFHNEAQQTNLEKKLLEYLVLAPVTTYQQQVVAQAIAAQGLGLVRTDINTIDPAATSPLFTYSYSTPTGVTDSKLAFALAWSGSTLKLSVYRPNGSLYQQTQSGLLPIEIIIPNAENGNWKYQVTGVDVPYSNYPYVVGIGTELKKVYLPIILKNPDGSSPPPVSTPTHTPTSVPPTPTPTPTPTTPSSGTTRVSVASDGTQGNGASYTSKWFISADGRYIAFESNATNLVGGDTNGVSDIFVRDRQTGQTTRVSVGSGGTQGNGPSSESPISADGRYVVFWSTASNLVSGDTNGVSDVFVHDRQTGQTTRVSVGSGSTQGNGSSQAPSISADGRYIAFDSDASNLVGGDSNGGRDTFVHDRQTGQTTRVSVGSGGTQGNGNSFGSSISADGRYVAFRSVANNLVSNDTNGVSDVFVYDRQTGQMTRVSISSNGTQGNGNSTKPSLSADGRYVAFRSLANNLASGDTNGVSDAFVYDRQTGQTTRVSVGSGGTQGNGSSEDPSLSADGRYVVFWSTASNLVGGDTNGVSDIFVRDRQTGQTTRVSVGSGGTQGNGLSQAPSISADGRYVAFYAEASNLVSGDTNNTADVFVHTQ